MSKGKNTKELAKLWSDYVKSKKRNPDAPKKEGSGDPAFDEAIDKLLKSGKSTDQNNKSSSH